MTESARISPDSSRTDSELNSLLATIKERRGPHEEWMKQEYALMCFISKLDTLREGYRVWAKGEIHGKARHYPAILAYNAEAETVVAMAASGPDQAIEEHPIHLFWSSIPYVAAARETFYKSEVATTVVSSNKDTDDVAK